MQLNETFFKELESKSPEGFKHFKDWFIQYMATSRGQYIWQYYDFTDLPIEMQLGIIERYLMETEYDLMSYTMKAKEDIHHFKSFINYTAPYLKEIK